MIIPAAIGALVTPFYLFSDSYAMVAGAFILQGAFLGAIYGQNPCLPDRALPDRGAGDRVGLLLPQGAIWAGFTGPVLTYFAATQPIGFTDSDADRDDRRRDRVRHHPAATARRPRARSWCRKSRWLGKPAE